MGSNLNRYTDEEYLKLLNEYYIKLGRIPKKLELCSKYNVPSYSAYKARFGSMENAYKLAGIEMPVETKAMYGNKIKIEKADIITNVQNFYNKNGKIVIRDLRKKNGLPSTERVTKMFGSFQNLLLEAGISINEENKRNFNRIKLTDEQLLYDLKCFTEKHLLDNIYLPKNDEIDNELSLQSSTTYINRFHSFEYIYKLIGYDIKDFNNKALEKDMLEKYKTMCTEIGHVLDSREITNLSKNNNGSIYSTEAYAAHFGSLSNLQKICGYTPTRLGKSITREECIEMLNNLYCEIGDIPTYDDVNLCEYTPSSGYYVTEFGSWSNALRQIGLDIKNGRKYKTKDGEEFLSSYEYKFAMMLKKYNIYYERELLYRNIIDNFDRKFRFDFVIELQGVKYFIEIFGIEANDSYDKRKQEKIKICKLNNIPLIGIYRNDLYGKTHKQVYDILLNKIREIKLEVA